MLRSLWPRHPSMGEVGGQIGDTGVIEGEGSFFEVWDTQSPMEDLISHIGKLKKGTLKVGDPVLLKVETGPAGR